MRICSPGLVSSVKRAAVAALGFAAVFASGGAWADLPDVGVSPAFHADASDATKRTTTVSGDKEYVDRVNDASGGAVYATSSGTKRPWLDTYHGRTVFNFGARTQDDNSPQLVWQKDSKAYTDSSVREGFIVYSDTPGSRGFFWGSTGSTYHFHRDGVTYFYSGCPDAVKNGVIEVGGEAKAWNSPAVDGFHILHVRTTGNVTIGAFANDRKIRSGGIILAESVVFDSVLTDENAKKVYDYLYNKWFGGAMTVTGEPAEFGEPTPGYGVCLLEPGDSKTFSVSGEFGYLNAQETIRGQATAHRIDTYDAASKTWTAGESAAGASCDITQTAFEERRLVWLWDTEYKTELTAGAGGTVSAAGWTAYGQTFAATATPAAGKKFYKWTGDVGSVTNVSCAALAITNVVAPNALHAVFCDTDEITPRADGGDDYATISAAVTAAKTSGAPVKLAPGTFHISQSIVLDAGVTIRGAGRDETVVRPTANGFRGFYLKHKDAKVCDLAVTGFYGEGSYNYYGIGIRLSAGTVENCHVYANKRASLYQYGTGIFASGVNCKVLDCVIESNSKGGGLDGEHGGGLYLDDYATARGCFVRANTIINNESYRGAGVYLNNGRLFDSTVVENTNGTGIYLATANCIVSNCVTALNSGQYSIGPSPADLGVSSWTCTNKVYNTLVGDGADFVDAANGDFRLRGMAATKDAGFWRFDPTADYADFAADAPKVFQTSNITLRAALYGKYAGTTPSWKVTDANGNEQAVTGDNPATLTLANTGLYTVAMTAGGTTVTRTGYLEVRAPVTDVPAEKDALYAVLSKAIAGETLKLADGTHETTKQLILTRDIRIVGSSYTNCTVTRVGSSNFGIFVLNSAGASLRGLTVSKGKASDFYYVKGSGVRICANGGTVEWCRITDNHDAAYYTDGLGVALMSSAALASHCVIDANTGSGRECGGGVYLSDGTIDNCLIVKNNAKNGGGIYCSGSGKILNCTLAKNTATGVGGGFYHDGTTYGETVYNTLVSDNKADNDTVAQGKPNWSMSHIAGLVSLSNRFHSCAFASTVSLGVGSIVVAAPFMDVDNGDYSLKASSPAVNGGVEYDGIASVDLAGNPRMSAETAPDIGCYEFDSTQVSCDFAASPLVVFRGESVTLTPTVVGAGDRKLTHVWTLRDENGTETVVTNAQPVVTPPGGYYGVTLVVYDAEKEKELARMSHDGSFRVVVKTVYVKPSSPHMAAPYDSWETAHTNLNDVLAGVADGCTVMIGEGTNVTRGTVEVTKRLTFTGCGRDTTVVKGPGTGRVFYLNNADAVVEGVTIRNGNANVSYNCMGGGVYIGTQGGTLRDCRVTDCFSSTYYVQGVGVGISSDKAYVKRCIIDRNTGCSGQSMDFGGLAVFSGHVEDCLVCSNKSFGAAGLALFGSGTVSNCTFAANTATTYAGCGLYGKNASFNVVNCIFAGNVGGATGTSGAFEVLDRNELAFAYEGGTTRASVFSWLNGNMKNCCLQLADPEASYGVRCLNADPKFADAAACDYRLLERPRAERSPCIDAGAYVPWMLGATDLDGRPRVKKVIRGKGRVDMGCCESDYRPIGLMLFIR